MKHYFPKWKTSCPSLQEQTYSVIIKSHKHINQFSCVNYKCNKYINGVTLNINWGHLSHFLNPLSQLEPDKLKNKFYILKYIKKRNLNQLNISQLLMKWCKRDFIVISHIKLKHSNVCWFTVFFFTITKLIFKKKFST